MIKENDYRDEKGSEYIQGGKTCIQSLEEKNWQTRSILWMSRLLVLRSIANRDSLLL